MRRNTLALSCQRVNGYLFPQLGKEMQLDGEKSSWEGDCPLLLLVINMAQGKVRYLTHHSPSTEMLRETTFYLLIDALAVVSTRSR